jgi:hypothetical protein
MRSSQVVRVYVNVVRVPESIPVSAADEPSGLDPDPVDP